MADQLIPAQRTLRAKIAAHHSWTNTQDRLARAAAARKAAWDRFDQQVDPERSLPPEEQARHAKNAGSAYFSSLALRSSQARAVRRQTETGMTSGGHE